MKEALESQYLPQNDTTHRSCMKQKESSWDISEIQTTNNSNYTLAENYIFNFRV